MYQTSTQTTEDILNFSFTTTYRGNDILLTVMSGENERYNIMHDGKTIGYIKLGDIRHTWYVVDSNYIGPYLVNEIGNRIEAMRFSA